MAVVVHVVVVVVVVHVVVVVVVVITLCSGRSGWCTFTVAWQVMQGHENGAVGDKEGDGVRARWALVTTDIHTCVYPVRQGKGETGEG